jgi:hypothetical protein
MMHPTHTHEDDLETVWLVTHLMHDHGIRSARDAGFRELLSRHVQEHQADAEVVR